MLSVAASRPALLARARLPASARSTRPEAAVAAAPRSGRITIARRPLAATMTKTAAMKSDVECSATSSSPAESFVFKVRTLPEISLENKRGTRKGAEKEKTRPERHAARIKLLTLKTNLDLEKKKKKKKKNVGLPRRSRRGPSQPPLRPRLPRRRGRRSGRWRRLQGLPARDPPGFGARGLLRPPFPLPKSRQPEGVHRRRPVHRRGAGHRGQHRVDLGLPQEDLLERERERERERKCGMLRRGSERVGFSGFFFSLRVSHSRKRRRKKEKKRKGEVKSEPLFLLPQLPRPLFPVLFTSGSMLSTASMPSAASARASSSALGATMNAPSRRARQASMLSSSAMPSSLASASAAPRAPAPSRLFPGLSFRSISFTGRLSSLVPLK